MSFEYDIFISYGHIDDEDPAGNEKGWVDLFVERLPRIVATHIGNKPRVWRDEHSLRGNDLLHPAIVEAVSRSCLFVPIVTPRYVLSDWCRRELETFCATGATAGPHRSRIFKVVKTPLLLLPDLKEPDALRDLLGYEFYKLEGGMPREYSTDDEPPYKDQRYWDVLDRLAWHIAGQLVAMQRGSPALTTTAAPAPSQALAAQPPVSAAAVEATAAAGTLTSAAGAAAKFVYLAETASDLTDQREAVRDELRQRGYGVLPEKKLPYEERSSTEEAVRAALERCCLSLHMVGAKYGPPPEDDPTSVVQIQEALAAERAAADGSFQRLLWMPHTLATGDIKDKRQREFVEALQKRVAAGSEVLQTTLEDLKTRVVEKLTAKPAARAAAGPPRGSKFRRVYLICDNSDRSFVRPIKQYLFKENFEVITWRDGAAGDSAERLMEYHRKYLCECDAALIYFGNGDELWVHKNLDDLVDKAYGYGREEDWRAKAVYVGAPPNEEKEDFLTHDALVIRNVSGFNPEDLREFVSAVRAAEGGQQ